MNKKHHRLNGVLVGGAIAFLMNPAHLPAGIMIGFLSGTIPDLDAKRTGVFSRLSKRKALHNMFVCIGLFLGGLISPYVLYFAIGAFSHVVLDMFCSRRGVGLFYPFSSNEIGTNGGVTVDDDRAVLMTFAMSGFQIAFFWFLLSPFF